MTARPDPRRTPVPAADSLAAWLRWTHFRSAFVAALATHLPAPGRAEPHAVAGAFWAWAAVLEHDAAFEALDPVDHAHFAAGQLLARLLVNRPIVSPPLPPGVEAQLLTRVVLDRLQGWRRAHGAAPLDGPPIDVEGAAWASFLENTAQEPELAIAFLDEFTGLEPVWRFPQLIAERPAMRRARRADRGPADGTPAG